jgi:hypothetical protein
LEPPLVRSVPLLAAPADLGADCASVPELVAAQPIASGNISDDREVIFQVLYMLSPRAVGVEVVFSCGHCRWPRARISIGLEWWPHGFFGRRMPRSKGRTWPRNYPSYLGCNTNPSKPRASPSCEWSQKPSVPVHGQSDGRKRRRTTSSGRFNRKGVQPTGRFHRRVGAICRSTCCDFAAHAPSHRGKQESRLP